MRGVVSYKVRVYHSYISLSRPIRALAREWCGFRPVFCLAVLVGRADTALLGAGICSFDSGHGMSSGRHRRRTFLGRTVHGFGCVVRAATMVLRSPRILLLAGLPFALCMVLYVAFFGVTLAFVDEVVDVVIQPGAWWRNALRWAMVVTVPLAVFVLSVFTYTFACLVIAAPLYEFLSATVERRLTGLVAEEPFTLKAMLQDIWRALADTARILLIEVGVLMLGLIFVPVTTVLAAMASAVLLALEYCDYPMGRRRMPFSERLGFARRHIWEMFGLGMPLLFALGIPFVGVAFLPLGVIGGTILFVELRE